MNRVFFVSLILCISSCKGKSLPDTLTIKLNSNISGWFFIICNKNDTYGIDNIVVPDSNNVVEAPFGLCGSDFSLKILRDGQDLTENAQYLFSGQNIDNKNGQRKWIYFYVPSDEEMLKNIDFKNEEVSSQYKRKLIFLKEKLLDMYNW